MGCGTNIGSGTSVGAREPQVHELDEPASLGVVLSHIVSPVEGERDLP